MGRQVKRAGVAALAAASLYLLPTCAAVAERHVTAGRYHACVVAPGGAVECFGDDFLVPAITAKGVAPAGIPFVTVTVGDDFTCGLTTNGRAVCWGEFPGAPPDAATPFTDIHAGANNLCVG